MGLSAGEPLGGATDRGCPRSGTLSAGLLVVVPLTDRLQVGLGVVVVVDNVINVDRGITTPLTPSTPGSTAMTISSQHPLAPRSPVRGESVPPV